MIPHDLVLRSLKKHVGCVHFLKYVERHLKAGTVDSKSGNYHKRNIGLPQGSPLSPILANIVLHELDSYIMEELKTSFDKGKSRRYNPEYDRLQKIMRRADVTLARKARIERRKFPAKDPLDPNFKRLLYVRYADDFVILTIGSKEDTLNIRESVRSALQERCQATLNIDKTLVSNIKDGFDFLGAHIRKLDNKAYLVHSQLGTTQFTSPSGRKVPLKLFITAPILKIN